MAETDVRLDEGSLSSFHITLYRASQAQRGYLGPKISELGLGPGQPKVLTYLAVRGPSSQREIAEFFDNDPGTISRMLDSLERGGFVSAAPGRDRRVKMVSLTEKGRDAAVAWEEACDGEQERLLEELSTEELEQLKDSLERVCRSLCGTKEGNAQ